MDRKPYGYRVGTTEDWFDDNKRPTGADDLDDFAKKMRAFTSCRILPRFVWNDSVRVVPAAVPGTLIQLSNCGMSGSLKVAA
jgi:hypothetical protein